MATGASNSDLAVLVVNANKGLTIQTHRHARIAALLGIRHLVMAVNKMDCTTGVRRRFHESWAMELDTVGAACNEGMPRKAQKHGLELIT